MARQKGWLWRRVRGRRTETCPHSSARAAHPAILCRSRCPIPRHKMQTVKERTRFGLLVAALIFIGIGGGILYGAQRLIADARLVAHSNEVIGRLDELEARLRDAESAQRGYLLTGRVDYLAAYHNSRDRLPALAATVAGLVADNPAQARLAPPLPAQTQHTRHPLRNTLPAPRTHTPARCGATRGDREVSTPG